MLFTRRNIGLVGLALFSVLSVASAASPVPSSAPTLDDGLYFGVGLDYAHENLGYNLTYDGRDLAPKSHNYQHKHYVPRVAAILGYGRRVYDNYFALEAKLSFNPFIDNHSRAVLEIPQVQAQQINDVSYDRWFEPSLSFLIGRYWSKQLLVFSRLGVVAARFRVQNRLDFSSGIKFGPNPNHFWLPGARVGVGLQYALNQATSVRVEYAYTRFKTKQNQFFYNPTNHPGRVLTFVKQTNTSQAVAVSLITTLC